MPIEFRCNQCGRLLKTPDESAGRQAQCPACGALTVVPGAGAALPASVLPAAPTPGDFSAAGFPSGTPAIWSGGTEGQPASPPAGGYAWGPAGRAARDRVGPPATALTVVAWLGILFAIGFMLLVVDTARHPPPANQLPRGFGQRELAVGAAIWIALGSMSAAANVLILIGAAKMKRLKSYPLAMAASILALIPCIGPCCIFGIPFGIWALVALCDDSVRMAFQS